jgi:hypothetical protein
MRGDDDLLALASVLVLVYHQSTGAFVPRMHAVQRG